MGVINHTDGSGAYIVPNSTRDDYEWWSCGAGEGELVDLGIKWNDSVSATSVTLSPIVKRWDKYYTDNYGSEFSLRLNPDPSGAGFWSGYTWGTGSGWRDLEPFNPRTYERRATAYRVALTITTDSLFGSYSEPKGYFLPSGYNQPSAVFEYEIPALDSTHTIKYNANGGTTTPEDGTKIAGQPYSLAPAISKLGYTFVGWKITDCPDPAYNNRILGANGNYNVDDSDRTIWNGITVNATAQWEIKYIQTPIAEVGNSTLTCIDQETEIPLSSNYVWEYGPDTNHITTVTGSKNMPIPQGFQAGYIVRVTSYARDNSENFATSAWTTSTLKLSNINFNIPNGSTLKLSLIKVQIPDTKTVKGFYFKI